MAPPDTHHLPPIEDDEAERLALEAAVAVAREDVRAGRVVPHEQVREELLAFIERMTRRIEQLRPEAERQRPTDSAA